MSPRRRRASLAALAILAVMLVPGCGSSALSMAQLRSKVTSICLHGNRRLRAIAAPKAESGAGAFLTQGAKALAAELGQLRSLKTSGDAENVYRAALSAEAGELTALRGTVSSLSAGADTVPTVRALARGLAPLEGQADDAWRALQISACLTR